MTRRFGIISLLLFWVIMITVGYLSEMVANKPISIIPIIMVLILFSLVQISVVVVTKSEIKFYGLVPLIRGKIATPLAKIVKVRIDRQALVRTVMMSISLFDNNDNEISTAPIQMFPFELNRLISFLKENNIEQVELTGLTTRRK